MKSSSSGLRGRRGWCTAVGLSLVLLAACGGGGGGSDPSAEVAITGKAIAGPVSAGTVTAYELNADGSSGSAVGTATTDAGGAFRLVLTRVPAEGLRLVVSGGSYVSEADQGRTVSGAALSALLPAVDRSSGLRDVVITPLTSFVDRRWLGLRRAATPVSSAHAQADALIKSLYGIQATPPLYSLAPDFAATSGDAAILALLLGAFEQLAIGQGQAPAAVLQAIGDDLLDGVLDGRTAGGGRTSYPGGAAAPVNLATGAFLGALAQYLAPSNTATLIARAGLVFTPQTVGAVQAGVTDQMRFVAGPLGNNGALISGAAIGLNRSPLSALRKPLVTTVRAGGGTFRVGTAFAMRSLASSTATYVAFALTNLAAGTQCFVNLKNITYRDSAGAALQSNGLTYVHGSVRKLTASSIFTDTCLGPGETGLVADISTTVNFGAVAAMEFELATSNNDSSTPLGRATPTGYTVTERTGWQSLTVAVQNTGDGPLTLAGATGHMLFVLDDLSQPLMWGFALEAITPSGPLAAGASGSITDSTFFYDGLGSKLLVLVDFEGAAVAGRPGAASACADAPTAEALATCKLASRNQRLSALDATARRLAAGHPVP